MEAHCARKARPRGAGLCALELFLCACVPLCFAQAPPARLGGCEVVSSFSESWTVDCPSGTTVVSGGVECPTGKYRQLPRYSHPVSLTAWGASCVDDKDETEDRAGKPWALCCALTTMGETATNGTIWTKCEYRSTSNNDQGYSDDFATRLAQSNERLCRSDEHLLTAGVNCWHDDDPLGIRQATIVGSDGPTRIQHQCVYANEPAGIATHSIHGICCQKNPAWFTGHPSRAPRAAKRPGVDRSIQRWQAGDKDRYRCSATRPTSDGDGSPGNWRESSVCLLEPAWEDKELERRAWAPTNAVNRVVCEEGDIMVGASLSCDAASRPAGQQSQMKVSLSDDRNTFWRLQGWCLPWPSWDNDANVDWTPRVAAFCFPQNCGNAPEDWKLRLKTATGSVPFVTMKPASLSSTLEANTLTCEEGRSFDGLGDVTEVPRECQTDYTWTAPLPRCYPTVARSVLSLAGEEVATLTSTFIDLLAVTDVMIEITCAVGLAAKPGKPTSLPASTANIHNQFRDTCVPVPLIPSSGFSAVALDSYSFLAKWPPLPADQLLAGTWHYEYQHINYWPGDAALPVGDSELAGVLRSGAVQVIKGDLSVTQATILVDSARLLAQQTIGFAIRLANSNGETGHWREWSGRITLPCTCAATPPFSGVLDLFTHLSLLQRLEDMSNVVDVELQNTSPCIGHALLQRVDAGGAAMGSARSFVLKPLLRDECPTESDHKMNRFTVSLGEEYAPHVKFNVTRIPRTISKRSHVQYRLATDGAESVPTVQEVEGGTLFWVRLIGRVHTAVTADSPDPVNLQGAIVHAALRWGNATLNASRSDTNEEGAYDLLMAAPVPATVPMASVELRVWMEDDDAQGIAHDYHYAGTRKQFSMHGPRMAQVMRDLNFFDPSHVVLSGRITSEPRADEWRAFSGCGVERTVVDVFHLRDVRPNNVTGLYEKKADAVCLRSSVATRTDGRWEVAVPKNASVVVIPRARDGDLPHNFTGPAEALSYQHDMARNLTRRTELNFFDITARTVKLRVYGGKVCQFHVGTAIPTFVHEGCGGRKLTMELGYADRDAAGNEFTRYEGAPPVQLVVKGWDPIYRGQFQPPSTLTPVKATAFRQAMHDWMDKQPTARIDLRNQMEDEHPFAYQSPLEVRLKVAVRQACSSDDSKPGEWDPHYFVTDLTDDAFDTELQLFERYPADESDQYCLQVNGSVYIHDLTFEPPRVPTGGETQCHAGCVQKAEKRFDSSGNWSETTYVYTMQPNRVEWREDVEWDVFAKDESGPPPPPLYSFPFYYRPADSVLPPKRTHVVVAGDVNLFGEGNRMSIPTPPGLPVFILHDPPGSASTTSLEKGDSIELGQFAVSTPTEGTSSSNMVGGCNAVGIDWTFVSPPGGVEFKNTLATGDQLVGGTLEVDAMFGSSKENTLSRGYTYSETVTTSDDRGLVDGDASLALIYSGIIHVQEWRRIERFNDSKCKVHPPYPVMKWHDELLANDALRWVSKWHIREVTIPQILREIQSANSTRNDTASLEQLDTLLRANLTWHQTLAAFDKSIANAVPYDPRVDKVQITKKANSAATESMTASRAEKPTGPAAALGSSTKGLVGFTGTVTEMGKIAGTVPADMPTMHGNGPNFVLSFEGGSSRSFTIEIEQTNEGVRKAIADFESKAGGRADLKMVFSKFGVCVEFAISSAVGRSAEKGWSGKDGRKQQITVTLADSDIGDAFDVEVLIDRTYNTPVFKTIGGQSRCPYEQNTLPRESMHARLGYGQLNYVPPNSATRVKMLLDNRSPTLENWNYIVSVLPSTDPEGLHMTIAGQPIIVNNLWFYSPANEVTSLTLELSRAPGMPYRYENIMLVVGPVGFDGGTGDGTGRYGFNGGDCPQDAYSYAEVTLSVSFQEECNEIAWSGTMSKMHQVTASSDPDTWGDGKREGRPAGTTIAVRNPQYQQPKRTWPYSHKPRNGEPAMLRRVLLQYRRLGGDDTDWFDMVGSDDVMPDAIKGADEVSGIFAFHWRTNEGLSDGLYEVRAGTHCFMPQGAIDSSLEYVFAPIKRALVDHTPPVKFGEPTPGLALYEPGAKLEVVFSEPIQCQTPWSELTVRAWSHPPTAAVCPQGRTDCCPQEFPACAKNPSGYPRDPQPDVLTNQPYWSEHGERAGGIPLTLQYQCRDNTVQLAFDPKQAWTTLTGQLITVMLWDLRDNAFNPLERPVSWSFKVKRFDVSASLLHVSKGELTTAAALPPIPSAEYDAFKAKLTEEIMGLIDAALQVPQNATRRLLASPRRIGAEQIEITSLTQGVGSILFSFDIRPALDADGVLPSDAAAAFATALDASTHRDSAMFPVLSSLKLVEPTTAVPEADPASGLTLTSTSASTPTASSMFDFTIDTVLSLEDIAANMEAELALLPDLQPPIAALPPPAAEPVAVTHSCVLSSGRTVSIDLSFHSSMMPDGSASVDLIWHWAAAADSSPLTAAERAEAAARHLLVRWRQLPDTDIDDLDEIGEQEELDRRSWTPLAHTATPTAPLVHEVADAKHRLFILRLPVIVTGRDFEFEVYAAKASEATNSIAIKLFSQVVFVVGTPAPPRLLAFQQTTPVNVSLTVQLSAFNGVTKSHRSNRFVQGQLRYELGVTALAANGTALLTLPLQHFHFVGVAGSEGVTRIDADLGVLPSLPLPEAGTQRTLLFTLHAVSGYGRSTAASLSGVLHAVPASIGHLRTRQLALDVYQIHAQVPESSTPLLSYHAGYTFLLGVELHIDPASSATAVIAPSGASFSIAAQYPLPHTAHLPFHIYVCACNFVGCSAPVLHRIYPVFLSPPLFSAVTQLQVQPTPVQEQTRLQTALLQWRAMREISHPSLHTGFLVQWWQSAAADSAPPSASAVRSHFVGIGASAFNLTDLEPQLPVHVSLFAVMNHSSNYWIERDPRGLHAIYSQPAAFVLTLRRPVEGPRITAVTQVAANTVRLRAVQPTVRREEVERFLGGYVCTHNGMEPVWSGIGHVQSSYSLPANPSSVFDLTVAGLPTAAAGDRLHIDLTSQSFSLAGFSTPSTAAGTLVTSSLVGRPLPPLLVNLTQSPLSAHNDATLHLQLRFPKLHTSESVQVLITRKGATVQQASPSLAAVASAAPLQRLLSHAFVGFPVQRPVDELQLTLSTANVAGASDKHIYNVTLLNPPALRFPPNCCGYSFTSPLVPIFTIPTFFLFAVPTVLNTGNALVANSDQTRPASNEWVNDCDTTAVDYFDEAARQWKGEVTVTGGWFGLNRYVLRLKAPFTMTEKGNLVLAANQDQLAALELSVAGKLVRMQVTCPQARNVRVPLCFQFILKKSSAASSSIDPVLARETPLEEPTCTTPEQADRRLEGAGIPEVRIQQVGTASVIDQGKEHAFAFTEGAGADSGCAASRADARLLPSSMPSMIYPPEVRMLPDLPPYPTTAAATTEHGTPSHNNNDDNTETLASTAAGSSGAPEAALSSSTAAAVPASPAAEGTAPSATPMPVPGSSTGGDSYSQLPSPSAADAATVPSSTAAAAPAPPPAPSPSARSPTACMFTLLLRSVPSRLAASGSALIASIRQELSTTLHLPLDRVRVLKAKTAVGKAIAANTGPQSATHGHSLVQFATDSDTDVQLSVTFEPVAAEASSSESSSTSAFALLQSLVASSSLGRVATGDDSLLTRVAAVGDAVEIPVPACPDGTVRTVCHEAGNDVEWTEGNVLLLLPDGDAPSAALDTAYLTRAYTRFDQLERMLFAVIVLCCVLLLVGVAAIGYIFRRRLSLGRSAAAMPLTALASKQVTDIHSLLKPIGYGLQDAPDASQSTSVPSIGVTAAADELEARERQLAILPKSPGNADLPRRTIRLHIRGSNTVPRDGLTADRNTAVAAARTAPAAAATAAASGVVSPSSAGGLPPVAIRRVVLRDIHAERRSTRTLVANESDATH